MPALRYPLFPEPGYLCRLFPASGWRCHRFPGPAYLFHRSERTEHWNWDRAHSDLPPVLRVVLLSYR